MKIKRIFNFICFFVITPVATFLSSCILFPFRFENLCAIAFLWLWLILAYRYLIKLFD